MEESRVMMIDICLLGCGGMIPLPERRLSSMLIRYNGRMLLVDCGEGTQVAVREAGWGFRPIDALLLTHFHADHVAGIPGFLLTLGNSGRTEPFTIVGPSMLVHVISALTVICGGLPFELKLIELPEDEPCSFDLCGFKLKTLPVDHWMPCLAYHFELPRKPAFFAEKAKALGVPIQLWKQLQEGSAVDIDGTQIEPYMVLGPKRQSLTIGYCTDSRPTEPMIKFFEKTDLLVLEGMYGPKDSTEHAISKKHMTFEEAAQIAWNSHSSKLLLTHYSPSLKDPEEYLSSARDIFPNTYAGYDLMKTTLNW